MSVSGHDRVSPQSERNSESLTTELGEHLTPGFSHPTVQPYSIPVAGGCAFVCGTGHSHGTYGAAERCGAAVADRQAVDMADRIYAAARQLEMSR